MERTTNYAKHPGMPAAPPMFPTGAWNAIESRDNRRLRGDVRRESLPRDSAGRSVHAMLRINAFILMGCCASAALGQTPAHFSVRAIPTRTMIPPTGGGTTIELPTPTGPHRVGRIALDVVDSMRSERMTADPADSREIVLHVWYPTDDRSGTRASYLDVALEDSAVSSHYAFALGRLTNVQPHSFANATVAHAPRRLPVILFSHGLGLLSGFYTAFIENLASHGYVVVGVEHSWFSGAFTFGDGRVVTNRSTNADRQRDVIAQAEDLSFVVTVLQRLNRRGLAPATRLVDRLDLDNVGVFGHSRGGFASPHACRIDRRFKACLNLDGYSMTPAVMDSGITQPFMLIEEIEPWNPPPTDSALLAASMTRAQADSQTLASSNRFENAFAHMSGGAYVVISPGAVHNSFTDLGLILPERFPTARQPFARTIEITRAYMLAFFDTYLRGRPSQLLTGKSEEFPETWLTIYRPRHAKQVFPGTPTWDR